MDFVSGNMCFAEWRYIQCVFVFTKMANVAAKEIMLIIKDGKLFDFQSCRTRVFRL